MRWKEERRTNGAVSIRDVRTRRGEARRLKNTARRTTEIEKHGVGRKRSKKTAR